MTPPSRDPDRAGTDAGRIREPRDPAVLAPALAGAAMVVIGVVLYVVAQSVDSEVYAMTCTSSRGCESRDPVVFTLLGAAFKAVTPFLLAGAVTVAVSLACAALRDGSRAPRALRKDLPMRFLVALWALALVLVLGGVAFTVWASSPDVVNSTIRDCSAGSGCVQTPIYTAQQLAYSVVPAALTAGLVAVGLALVVTGVRAGGRAAEGVETAPQGRVGRREDDLTPFMPPADGSR